MDAFESTCPVIVQQNYTCATFDGFCIAFFARCWEKRTISDLTDSSFFFYFFFNLIYKQTLALLDYLISKKANMTFSQIVAVPTEEPMSSILSECPFTCLLNSQWETKQIRKAQAALCMQEPCTAKGPSLEAWSCMEQLHIQIHTFSSSFLLVNLNKTPLKKHSILSQLFEEAMESVFIYKGLVDDILVSLSDIIEIEKILFLFAF